MYEIEQTELIVKWRQSIKDPLAKASIARRIKRAIAGNFGDSKSVGGGVSEMRIDTGKGYRIYYAQKGEKIYLLINGGDKTTQEKDIMTAKTLWQQIKTEVKK